MKHITIVAADRVGLLADVSYILGCAHINIETLSTHVQGSKSIVDIGVKDEKRASELLRSNGYEVLESEMLVVRIKDEPAQMSKFTSLLSGQKIAVLAMNILAKGGTCDTYALKTDHNAKAKRMLREKGYLVEEKK